MRAAEFLLVVGISAGLTTAVIAKLDELINLGIDIGATEKKTVSVPPPVGKIVHYAALVTGSVTSSFPIAGRYSSFGCNQSINTSFQAVGTVMNKVGDFTVTPDPATKQVTITMDKPPELDGRLRMGESNTDLHIGTLSVACTTPDTVKLVNDVNRLAQATTDTLGACAIKRPEFVQGMNEQLLAIGQDFYKGYVVNVVPPPETTQAPASISALDRAKTELSQDGFSVDSSAIDNCTFEKFEMVPIILEVDG